jgi:uncharacterized protein (DUF2141 family)
MTRLFFFILIILTVMDLAVAQNQQNKQGVGSLTVQITGIQNSSGDVKAGLFNSEESFNGNEEKFKGITVKAENDKMTWSLRNIPFGYYAVKAFHDEDQDDDVDTKLGIPTEGFGFSNNPSFFFGAPSYDKAKFLFNSDSMTVEIKLTNF